DGYVRAEGCGVVILRRLADAQTEGDPVRGVIRGTAINHDGPSSGFTVPNGRAQVDLLRAALADADVRPDEVDYVEAHGTGTTLGDPIELGAIARVYASERSSARPLLVGSVKTNVGHLEAAAGIAGLIKALLALEHATIPRHLHFKEPNPHIAWDELAVTVPTANVPWTPGERPRRAGVSAFGLSGTNAHLILEEAPRDEVRPPRTAARSHLVAAISGPRDEVVNISAGRHARFLRARPEVDVSDVCHTLACGRVHHAHRLVIVARTREQLRADLESVAAGERPPSCVHGTRALAGGPPRIAFLFTGQGAQYPGMGRGLYECEPAFRAAIDRCDALARREFGVDLRGQLFDADEAAALETELAQPAIFALEYGLFRLWDTWGIRPDAVLGHSLGEYTAACVAGVLELEDALRLVLVRGRLMQSTRAGAMAVVDAPPDRVRAALDSLGALASVAAINGPSSVVISGEARIVHMICSRLAGDDIRSRRLPGTRAFHSPLMDPILDAFEIAAGKVQLSPPRLPMISCLTGAVASDEPASPRYWRRQLRGEVRFADGIQALDRLGCSIYVEVGPNPALLATASACAPLHDATLLPSLRRGREDAEVMYASLARLHVQGVQVDWRGFDRPFARRRIALPTYPFQRQRCWLPRTPPPPRWSLGGTPGAALHPLLGQRVPCPGRDIQYVSRVSFESHAYLVGQRLFGEPVATPALFLAVLIAAACDTVATSGVTLEDVLLLRPMVLSGPTHLHLQLSPGREGRIGFTLAGARSADVREASWLKHAIGKLRRIEVGHEPPVHNATLAELQGRCREEPSLTAFYEGFAAEGLEYGAHFRTLLRLWRNGSEAVALLDTPGLDEHEGVHPTIIDSCFQVLAAVLARRGQPGPYVPFSVERLYFYRTPTRSLWCHASLRAGGDDSTSTGDLWLCDDDGQLIVEITGLRIRKGTRKELFAGRARADADWQYVPVWRPRPLLRLSTADDEPRTWLVLRDRDPLGAALTRRLEERGSTCVIASPGYAFARDERDRFTIDPTRRDDFARLLAALAADGVKVDGVLFLWALDAALSEDGMHLERVQRRVYGSALHLTQTLLEARVSLSAGLFLVTRGAQSAGAPRPVAVGQAPLWGFGRVLLDEHPELHPRLVDLSPGDVHGEVEALAAELHADDGEDQIALRGEVRYGARLLRDQAPREPAAQSLDVPDTEAYRLEISEPGSLDTLGFRPTRRRPPGHGEVEIAVRAAGLSFRDVLSSLGMDRREPGVLGRECAGTVVAVGPDVSHLSLGDAVMGLARESLGPYVTADARHVVRTPASVELEDAAALPVAFLTAWYGLHHLGRMLPGDRVLIHAAAGGVGMAAVQLALRIGAEVYATASPGKWGTLRKLGVVNIYNSRTADYAREIAAATEGRGVDIVLNSLDGEFVPASMALLSPGGRFVELGEDRTWGARATSRFPGVAYRKVELRAVDPALIHQALTQLAEAFA
ncbi:MAG: acyltransferase domain-containing protein, partial [Myxococcales bacterium]|nr:acyltransferase domain-containing protein [Myxococcales bacterium]